MSKNYITYTTANDSIKINYPDSLKYDHVRNLLTLINILETEACAAQFDMVSFETDLEEPVTVSSSSHMDCGTAACALGWARACMINSSTQIHYFELAYFLFGLKAYLRRWYWLFDGNWAHFDNTIEGAVKRIKYYINHGQAPDWFPSGYFPRCETVEGEEFKNKYEATLATVDW